MEHHCQQCGVRLSENIPGNLCYPCQKIQIDSLVNSGKDTVDVSGYAAILKLDETESLRRLYRKGKLAPRIPERDRLLWYLRDIIEYQKRKQEEEMQARQDVGNRPNRKTARLIVSNLRRCSTDNIINCLTDVIGDNVYGGETILGTGQAGRIEFIELAAVPKKSALNLLLKLPAREFPELDGIEDWNEMPFDHISEDFLIRLESYF